MARKPRIEFAGAFYHIMSRGTAKQDIFVDDMDRLEFLDILSDVVSRYGWICHAFCLMNNHYHLLIETPVPNLSDGMRHLNGVYSQRFNRKTVRVGHLMQGRYTSLLVDKDSYLLTLAKYIITNAVASSMCARVEDWPWSSYGSTAGLQDAPDFLTTSEILGLFSENPAKAREAYVEFVNGGQSTPTRGV